MGSGYIFFLSHCRIPVTSKNKSPNPNSDDCIYVSWKLFSMFDGGSSKKKKHPPVVARRCNLQVHMYMYVLVQYIYEEGEKERRKLKRSGAPCLTSPQGEIAVVCSRHFYTCWGVICWKQLSGEWSLVLCTYAKVLFGNLDQGLLIIRVSISVYGKYRSPT